jgi:uncharacterized protein
MQVIIAGGSGLIGRELTNKLVADGDKVVILSRNPEKVMGMPAGVSVLPWDGKTLQDWVQQLDHTEAVINLTGENLSGKGFPPSRWTKERKVSLVQSRVNSGIVLSKAIGMSASKPSVFVQASGIGHYGTKQTKALVEGDQAGDDYLAKLTKDWEASSQTVEEMGVRRIIIRNGVVLSAQGGALPLLLLPYKLWVGGRMGNGKQVYSWIHIADEVAAIDFLIKNPATEGIFNLTSPNPLTNDEFGKMIGKVMKRPHYFPVPAFAMRLALGEVASMVLEGQRVLPHRLMELGYQFIFPKLDDALNDLLKN